MQIVPFNEQDHFNLLNEWLILHEHAPTTIEFLPKLGYVVTIDEKPIAMAFLRLIEGGMAYAESLVTSKDFSVFTRVKAIDLVVDKLVEVAKFNDFKYLITTTYRPGVVARITKRHGFIQSDAILAIKPI